MYQNSYQRLDLHALMLQETLPQLANRLLFDNATVKDVSLSNLREKDFRIVAEDMLDGSEVKTLYVECKTETHGKNNMLCLELASNLPGLPPTKAKVLKPADANAYKVRCLNLSGEEDKYKAFLLTEKPPRHLFSHWNKPLGYWSLWDSNTFIQNVLEHLWELPVCFGRNELVDRSWYSICVLVPEAMARRFPSLVALRRDVSEAVYTEAFVATGGKLKPSVFAA